MCLGIQMFLGAISDTNLQQAALATNTQLPRVASKTKLILCFKISDSKVWWKRWASVPLELNLKNPGDEACKQGGILALKHRADITRTGVLVAPQKELMSSKKFEEKKTKFGDSKYQWPIYKMLNCSVTLILPTKSSILCMFLLYVPVIQCRPIAFPTKRTALLTVWIPLQFHTPVTSIGFRFMVLCDFTTIPK